MKCGDGCKHLRWWFKAFNNIPGYCTKTGKKVKLTTKCKIKK